jgi:hypothetical protein
VGLRSLFECTTGANNTGLGYRALENNTTGTDNVAVGYQALDANTTGQYNVAMGSNALGANTTGIDNTAVGYLAGTSNTNGGRNTAMGSGALQFNTTGSYNSAFGRDALFLNTTGSNNTAVGYQALDDNTTGTDNTAVGYQSGDKVTTGIQNTILGTGAASSGTNDLTTGSNNIVLGFNAEASSATVSNEITLGNASVTKLRVPGLSVDWAADDVPFRNIPQNSQSAAYTLVLSDSGKHILHPSADTTARTFTIPANGSVAFPVGTAVTFINQNGGGDITIAITTDTLRLAGDGSTGSRTLTANGIATAVKVTSTEWIISGVNLT